MKILGIDHVAICVERIDQAAPRWLELLGLKPGPRETVVPQRTAVAFLLGPEEGSACVELIAPDGGNPGLEKFLAKRGPGLHHIAFLVDDLAAALAELDGRGVALIDRTPRAGARGHQVGFLHPSATGGTLVELVDGNGRHR